jgi:SAM-dependent methyltransferase
MFHVEEEWIDMSGQDQQPASIPPSVQLMQLIWPGAMAAQAIYAAAKLQIADLVAERPRTVEELARAAGCDGRSLHRLLGALRSLGVFEEASDGMVRNTPLSDALRHNVSGSMGAWALFLSAPFNWKLWGNLEETVRTGTPAAARVYGRSFWEYLAQNPADAAVFNNAMSAGSQMSASAVVSGYDFSQFKSIVDVGGGHGELLHGILSAAPQLKGVLFDLPEVVANADILRNTAVAARAEIVGGSFFDRVPPADAYILHGVIHDWNDTDAVAILKSCRRAITPGGKLLIATSVLNASGEPDRGSFMDIYMMLYGGCERTEDEFRAILAESGFLLKRVITTSRQWFIVEGEPI